MKTTPIKETGVPLPKHHAVKTGLTALLRSLSVGDSFVTSKESRVTPHTLARGLGIKVVTRSISATEIRVWRSE